MREKYILKIGERGSEVHLYPTRHSIEGEVTERKWYGLKRRLGDIKKGFHAIAIEQPRPEEFREGVREALRTGKKYPFPKKDAPIVKKCKEEKLNLVFIDSRIESTHISAYIYGSRDDKIKHSIRKNIEKLPEKWRRLLKKSDSFRSLVMASNLEQAVKLHEKYNEGPVKIAVLAEKDHVEEIMELLTDPEYKKVKDTVRKLTRGKHGIVSWRGLLVLTPENLAIEG